MKRLTWKQRIFRSFLWAVALLTCIMVAMCFDETIKNFFPSWKFVEAVAITLPLATAFFVAIHRWAFDQ